MLEPLEHGFHRSYNNNRGLIHPYLIRTCTEPLPGKVGWAFSCPKAARIMLVADVIILVLFSLFCKYLAYLALLHKTKEPRIMEKGPKQALMLDTETMLKRRPRRSTVDVVLSM